MTLESRDTMASPLFSLGNCLHELESKFGEAIMESILRLSSLTDANVFLVVETPQGKRFCGKERLCRSFAEGKLTFDNEKDCEMRLSNKDVGLTAVRRPDLRPADSQSDDVQTEPAQRTYSKFQSPARVSDLYQSFNNILSDTVSSIGDSPSIMSASTLKRRLPSISLDHTSTPKSTKTNLQANPFKVEPWDDSLLGLANSLSSRVCNAAPPTSVNAAAPTFDVDNNALQSCIRALQSESNRGSSLSLIKNEIVLTDSDDEMLPPSRPKFERQGDACFELGRRVDSDSNWSSGTTLSLHPSTSSSGNDVAVSDYAPSIDGSLQLDHNAGDNSFYSLYSTPSIPSTSVVPAFYNSSQNGAIYATISPDELPEVRASLRRYLLEDMKAIAVFEYEPGDLLVKESAGYKILSSLLYDVGKKYGTHSIESAPPETDSLRYFYVCFDEFCSYFPNLSSVFNHKLVIGKKNNEGPAFAADNRTFKTFMRSKMQRTFGRYSKRHT